MNRCHSQIMRCSSPVAAEAWGRSMFGDGSGEVYNASDLLTPSSIGAGTRTLHEVVEIRLGVCASVVLAGMGLAV